MANGREDYAQNLASQTTELTAALTAAQEASAKHESRAAELEAQLEVALSSSGMPSGTAPAQHEEMAALKGAKVALEASVTRLTDELDEAEKKAGLLGSDQKRLEAELATAVGKLAEETALWSEEREAMQGQVEALKGVAGIEGASQERIAALEAELKVSEENRTAEYSLLQAATAKLQARGLSIRRLVPCTLSPASSFRL